VRAKAGSNVRYVNPARIDPARENKVYLRSLVVKNDAVLELRLGKHVIKSVKKTHVQPSEMISVNVGPKDFQGQAADFVKEDATLEFSIA